MPEKVSLPPGQRYFPDGGKVVLHLLSGKADLFAYVGENKQQMYLSSRVQDEWFFYLGNNDDNMRLLLMAKDYVELEVFQLDEFEQQKPLPDGMLEHLTDWLQQLWQVNWVHREVFSLLDLMDTANFGTDDWASDEEKEAPLLEEWLSNPWHVKWVHGFARHGKLDMADWKKTSGGKEMTVAEVGKFLGAQQKTLAILLNMHLQGLKESFDLRVHQKEKKTDRLMDSAMRLLLGRLDAGQADSQVETQTEGMGRLVLAALEHFRMEAVDLTLPRFVLDTVHGEELLKLLLKKANIFYRKILLEPDWQKKDNGTLIFTLQGELVLAEPVTDHSYCVRWSDGRSASLTDDLAEQASSSDAWLLYAGLPKHSLNIRGLLTFLYRQSWPTDWLAAILLSFVSGLVLLLTPIITDKLFSDVIPIHDYAGVTTITQVMVVSAFTSVMLRFVRCIAILRLNVGCGQTLDAALWGRLLSLPLSFFKQFAAGELNQRIMSFEAIKGIFTPQVAASIFDCIFSLWSLLLMFYYSSRLALASLAIWLIYLGLSWLVFYRKPYYMRELVKNSNENSGMVVQLFAGLSKFRCRGSEEQAFYLWSRSFSKKWQTQMSIRKLTNCGNVLNSVLPIIMMMALYYYAMELSKDSSTMVQLGDFIAFWAAYTGFNDIILRMVPLAVQLIGMSAYTDNVKTILEAVPEDQSDKLDAGKLTGEIELHDVTFGYTTERNVLQNISLYIRPGESVALVGPSGCGKSTLLRLLLGFEKPQKGTVLYDRKDLADLSPESVRRQLGVVLQDGKLLPGSIWQNIIGTKNLTIDDAWAAAEKVGLAQDIQEMPMQMDTVISEDAGNISGGQKQRILLARSMVGAPAIMVLDEATSALDNKTQDIVTRSLNKVPCTRIIVAHRLSTIRLVDRIVVLDKGTIAEEGTFDELMQRGGLFAHLAKRQIA